MSDMGSKVNRSKPNRPDYSSLYVSLKWDDECLARIECGGVCCLAPGHVELIGKTGRFAEDATISVHSGEWVSGGYFVLDEKLEHSDDRSLRDGVAYFAAAQFALVEP